MARGKGTDNTNMISARFNPDNPDQARALEIMRDYQKAGRSLQSIITTAILASEGLQFQEPTLGDVAARQVLISVQTLGELIEEMRGLRLARVSDPAAGEPYQVDADPDDDYSEGVIGYMRRKKNR